MIYSEGRNIPGTLSSLEPSPYIYIKHQGEDLTSNFSEEDNKIIANQRIYRDNLSVQKGGIPEVSIYLEHTSI